MRRKVWTYVALGMVTVLGTTFGVAAAGAQQKVGPVLRIGLFTAPTGLDPAKVARQEKFDILSYATLIHENPNGTFGPALATKFGYVKETEKSKLQNKVYQLTLRKDARFSDGEQVNAPAVVGWLNYLQNAKGPWSNQMGPNPQFTAIGQWTVRIQITVPNPIIPYLLSECCSNWGFVASPQAVANPSTLSTGTAGAGPYMMDTSRTVLGDHYTFVPNPYYYDKKNQKFSEVDVKIISVASSMLQAIQSGQLDEADGDPSTVQAALSSGLGVAHIGFGEPVLYLADWKGTISPPLADVRVRQAMNYAIDRKAIVKALYGTYAHATSGMETFDASDPSISNYYSYNPKKAKALLAAAGYANGFTVKVVDSGAGSAVAGADLLWQAVAKYEDAVGIHLDIKTDVNPNPDRFSGQFPILGLGYGILSTTQLYSFTLPTGVLNVFHVDDPTADRMYYQGLRDASVWKPMWLRVTKQAYYVVVVVYDILNYYNPHTLKGVVDTKWGGFLNPLSWSPA